MAWMAEHRRAADRRGLRYPSDLTDAEWGIAQPIIRPAKRGGRPRKVDLREVLNGIFDKAAARRVGPEKAAIGRGTKATVVQD